VYGRLLRQLRESKGRGQADVARSVGISPAQLARLESNQRGLYVEDFVNIVEALGEKPGNLLSNDLGDIGHLKSLIDRLAGIKPEFLPSDHREDRPAHRRRNGRQAAAVEGQPDTTPKEVSPGGTKSKRPRMIRVPHSITLQPWVRA
jgi:transcriptional regulator with XRE-family HTH domain